MCEIGRKLSVGLRIPVDKCPAHGHTRACKDGVWERTLQEPPVNENADDGGKTVNSTARHESQSSRGFFDWIRSVTPTAITIAAMGLAVAITSQFWQGAMK